MVLICCGEETNWPARRHYGREAAPGAARLWAPPCPASQRTREEPRAHRSKGALREGGQGTGPGEGRQHLQDREESLSGLCLAESGSRQTWVGSWLCLLGAGPADSSSAPPFPVSVLKGLKMNAGLGVDHGHCVRYPAQCLTHRFSIKINNNCYYLYDSIQVINSLSLSFLIFKMELIFLSSAQGSSKNERSSFIIWHNVNAQQILIPFLSPLPCPPPPLLWIK